jgi:hypothetical protein
MPVSAVGESSPSRFPAPGLYLGAFLCQPGDLKVETTPASPQMGGTKRKAKKYKGAKILKSGLRFRMDWINK